MTTTITTHPTYLGLLADIIEHPDDDTPRLILADWLEDHDWRPAGRFIRTQIAGDVASLPLSWSASVIDAFCGLGLGYRGSVTNGLGQSSWRKKDGSVVCLFRRGFLAEIHAPLAVLIEHLPQLVKEHPIEAVRATDREPQHFSSVPNVWPEHWTWWQDETDDTNDFLGEELLALLEPGLPAQGEGGRGKNYPTADAAHAALSVALLKWTKSQPIEVPA